MIISANSLINDRKYQVITKNFLFWNWTLQGFQSQRYFLVDAMYEPANASTKIRPVKVRRNSKLHRCEYCDYETKQTGNYRKHTRTARHYRKMKEYIATNHLGTHLLVLRLKIHVHDIGCMLCCFDISHWKHVLAGEFSNAASEMCFQRATDQSPVSSMAVAGRLKNEDYVSLDSDGLEFVPEYDLLQTIASSRSFIPV